MPASAPTSSVVDAAQFDTGSGDRLMSARVPAFAKCDAPASVPPASAAIVEHGGIGVAERTGREHGARRNADERVDGVPQGIDGGDFVGEKFDEREHRRDADHPRRAEHRERIRQMNESHALEHAGDENGEVQAQPARP